MPRTILTQRDIDRSITMGAIGATPAEMRVPDGYTDRLIKYIPPDVIAAYITIEGIVSAAPPAANVRILAWVVFAVISLACPFYLVKGAGVFKPAQVALSTTAFFVWAFAYNGPPWDLVAVPAVWRAAVLALFTFLVPLLTV